VTILLILYGIAILVLALILVGIVHRLMTLEANIAGPREPRRPMPEWLASRIDGTKSHHLVIVVDDSCSICHRTVEYLNSAVMEQPQLSELVTVLSNSESFHSANVPVLVDVNEHRNLHPGWAPAALVFSAEGLVERVPAGSQDSLAHVIDRLNLLTALTA